MGNALKIAHTDESEPYVPRIRALLLDADFRGARDLLAEARRHGSAEPGLEKLVKLLAPPRQELRPASDFDRTPEFHWLEQHAAEYRGQWVALLGHELLAHAKTLDEVTAKLAAAPPKARPLLHRIH